MNMLFAAICLLLIELVLKSTDIWIPEILRQ